MGVKECFRSGCEEIMCDRYSDRHGYICEGCFKELKESGIKDISAFMMSPKPDKEQTLEEVFPLDNSGLDDFE